MGRNSNFYDNADSRTYRFPAAAIAAGGVLGRIGGPVGKVGRVRGIEYVVTTGVTNAASVITVGNNGAANPATTSVPVSGVNSVGGASDAELKSDTVTSASSLVVT